MPMTRSKQEHIVTLLRRIDILGKPNQCESGIPGKIQHLQGGLADDEEPVHRRADRSAPGGRNTAG